MTDVRTKKATYKISRFSAKDLLGFTPNPAAVRTYYRTARDDTWESVSAKTGVPVNDIVALNIPGAVSHGRVDQARVNHFLVNARRFRCPYASDGVNAMFAGGEQIAIPKAGISAMKDSMAVAGSDGGSSSHLAASGPIIQGGSTLVWAESTPELTLTSISNRVRDSKGNVYQYNLHREGSNIIVRVFPISASVRSDGMPELHIYDTENTPEYWANDNQYMLETMIIDALDGKNLRNPRVKPVLRRFLAQQWVNVEQTTRDPHNLPRMFFMWVGWLPIGGLRMMGSGPPKSLPTLEETLDSAYDEHMQWLKSLEPESSNAVTGRRG